MNNTFSMVALLFDGIEGLLSGAVRTTADRIHSSDADRIPSRQEFGFKQVTNTPKP
jgi:hypothetical protein